MEIKDLRPGTRSVTLDAKVYSKDSEREINKYGRQLRVAHVTLKDRSGTITATLWNDQIDQVKVGDMVHVENGYVNEWQGTPLLTLGKFGKLTVL